MRRLFGLLTVSAWILMQGVFVLAQDEGRCANCHFANPLSEPAGAHLDDWALSAHSRQFVGCQDCHGGDASTFESFRSHRGILNSSNPASPVHPLNIHKTCGSCHTGQSVAFRRSRHFELLEQGDQRGPTCTTCHGDVAARLLSPNGLERRCAQCHGSDGVVARPEFPPRAGELLRGVYEVRRMLAEARAVIRRIRDQEEKEDLEASYRQAEVPLIEAVYEGHSFVFDQLTERLTTSKDRAEALLDRLANREQNRLANRQQ